MGRMDLQCLICLQFTPNNHLHLLPLLRSQVLHLLLNLLPLLPLHLLHHLSLRPQRIRGPRSEWMPDQWTVPQCYKQIREPTPAIPFSDEDSDDPDDPIDLINANSASITEPTLYKQSQQCFEAQLWHTACEEEMEAHSVNGIWEIVKLPPGKRAIGSRWFMKVKRNADGSLDRHKARLVAKGYSQRPGFDFKETFAPTVCYATIRTIPLQRLRTSLCGHLPCIPQWDT
jgi:hypothetical protein